MSFLDGIGDAIGSLFGGSNNVGGNLLSALLSGFALNKLQDDVDTGNSSTTRPVEVTPDYGVRLQGMADPHQKIPVVYGEAFTGGKCVDMRQPSRDTMQYCMILSEKTGATNLGAGPDSVISFEDIYWNNSRVVFRGDGTTVDYTVDRNGKVDRSMSGLVKFYCYNNGSTGGVLVDQPGSPPNAYTIMDGWDSTWTLDELVFIIIEVTYSREKNLTGLPQVICHLKNSLKQPGDVMYDYMTNTRYGAGIDSSEINVS